MGGELTLDDIKTAVEKLRLNGFGLGEPLELPYGLWLCLKREHDRLMQKAKADRKGRVGKILGVPVYIDEDVLPTQN